MSANTGKDRTDGANILVVSKSGDSQFDSISQAIRQAPAGTRILVGPGIYREAVTINKPLEIIGDGPAKEIIVEGLNVPALRMQAAQAVVRGLTLRGIARPGQEYNAIDIEQGSLILEDCDVTSKGICIGIHGATSAPTIRRCTIHHGDCGVYFYEGSQGTIEDCDISESEGSGVEIWDQANPVFRRCQIKSAGGSGIMVNNYGRGVLEDCNIFGNALSEDMINMAGAAEVTIVSGGATVLHRCRIHDGNSSGVFVASGGRGELIECDIYGNRFSGIQVGDGGNSIARGCRINRNGGRGVWIQLNGTADLQGCELTGNAMGEQQVDQQASTPPVADTTKTVQAASTAATAATAASERSRKNVASQRAKAEPETLLGSLNGHPHGLKEFQADIPNVTSLSQVLKSVAEILQFDSEIKIASKAAPHMDRPESSLWFKILAEYDSPVWKGIGGKPVGKIQASFIAVQEDASMRLLMQFSDLDYHWVQPGSENKVVEMLFAVADRLQQGLRLETPLLWQATKGDWYRRDIVITVPPRRPVYLKSPRPQSSKEEELKQFHLGGDNERPAKPPGMVSQIFTAINQFPPLIKLFTYAGMLFMGIRWFQVTTSVFELIMLPLAIALGGVLGFCVSAAIQCGINDSQNGKGSTFARYMLWGAAIPAGLLALSVIFGRSTMDKAISGTIIMAIMIDLFIGTARYLHVYSKEKGESGAASKS